VPRAEIHMTSAKVLAAALLALDFYPFGGRDCHWRHEKDAY
jgi:hypothetical protein